MTPDQWGPILWHFMHSYSLTYPVQPTESDKSRAIAYFESIPSYISCQTCAEHFSQLLEANPPITDSRATLSEWVYDVHNLVNARLGKPQFSHDQFINAYSPVVRDGQPVPSFATRFVGSLLQVLGPR